MVVVVVGAFVCLGLGWCSVRGVEGGLTDGMGVGWVKQNNILEVSAFF